MQTGSGQPKGPQAPRRPFTAVPSGIRGVPWLISSSPRPASLRGQPRRVAEFLIAAVSRAWLKALAGRSGALPARGEKSHPPERTGWNTLDIMSLYSQGTFQTRLGEIEATCGHKARNYRLPSLSRHPHDGYILGTQDWAQMGMPNGLLAQATRSQGCASSASPRWGRACAVQTGWGP